MALILRALRHYADFAGRSRAAEIWSFQLGQLMVVAAVYVLFAVIVGFEWGAGTGTPVLAFQMLMALLVAFVIGTLIPLVAMQVRRFHDQAMSGWFLLLGLIPYLGPLILLFFLCRPGTKGANRYGPDPRDELTRW
ncbi:DUF805 domain-containing protein [Sphingomonas sp. H39-1-10]|uniref:DUF805 domain-containing protein n=1 Tax=Sphingomonas TaxID=13687 RepID=UPI0008904221|nr:MULTISPECIES: DUF805 domain-containing protein [Sphingomonas]MDF0489145.1 DUF805 domain-containing protein [Sphingomonas pollutisoli]SDA21035.1 Uncharacterized membrane protein YhaH, DUF805 family [Sphingomonas sp. NFR15]